MAGSNNPYASPAFDPRRVLPVLPRDQWDFLDIRVMEIQRSAWRRVVTITGSVTACIMYNSAGFGERVYVNDRLTVKTSGFDMSANVKPRVDFDLEYGGYRIPARIEVAVQLSWAFMSISKFRLTIADKNVYEE